MAKYTCDLPGLEDNFVEFSDSWSRKQLREFLELRGEDYVNLVFSKLTACYLVCPDAEPITEPVKLDDETLDAVDMRLVGWLKDVPVRHVVNLQDVGEALRLRLFVSTETKKSQEIVA